MTANQYILIIDNQTVNGGQHLHLRQVQVWTMVYGRQSSFLGGQPHGK